MNECKICSKDIKKDSQYINGNYYHNECIEKLEHNWNELKKWLEEYIENIKFQYQNSDPTRQYSLEIIKDTLQVTIDRMQELEEGGNNE